LASAAQVTSVVEVVHTLALLVHTLSVLHVHAAEPALPVHVWREPQATAAAAYAQQPFDPSVHVARSPLTHAVSPDLQLSVHFNAHAAPASVPASGSAQDSGAVHGVVPETYRQPFESFAHVATV
jgi:hypothetical protein